jgi:hypothetical protein
MGLDGLMYLCFPFITDGSMSTSTMIAFSTEYCCHLHCKNGNEMPQYTANTKIFAAIKLSISEKSQNKYPLNFSILQIATVISLEFGISHPLLRLLVNAKINGHRIFWGLQYHFYVHGMCFSYSICTFYKQSPKIGYWYKNI